MMRSRRRRSTSESTSESSSESTICDETSFYEDEAKTNTYFYEMLLSFCSCMEEGEKKFIHSRNRKAFYKKLSAAEKRRRDRRIPRVALHFPKVSAWRKLYSSDNDQAMITLTGFDHATFGWVLSMFSAVYDRYTPYSQSGEIIKLR